MLMGWLYTKDGAALAKSTTKIANHQTIMDKIYSSNLWQRALRWLYTQEEKVYLEEKILKAIGTKPSMTPKSIEVVLLELKIQSLTEKNDKLQEIISIQKSMNDDLTTTIEKVLDIIKALNTKEE